VFVPWVCPRTLFFRYWSRRRAVGCFGVCGGATPALLIRGARPSFVSWRFTNCHKRSLSGVKTGSGHLCMAGLTFSVCSPRFHGLKSRPRFSNWFLKTCGPVVEPTACFPVCFNSFFRSHALEFPRSRFNSFLATWTLFDPIVLPDF